MDESVAWLNQGIADRAASERFAADEDRSTRCHALAKCQQAVEKSVKAIVAALRDAGVLHIEIGFGHAVEPFLRVLVRLPRPGDTKTIRQHLNGLLDEATRAGIRALDALAPRRPPPGGRLRRNTEYPFHAAAGGWTYPADETTFSAQEMNRFRALAYRVVAGAGRIVSAIRRGPD